MTVRCGEKQWRGSVNARGGLRVRAGLDEHVEQLDIAVGCRPVQGCHAVALRRTNVGAVLQKLSHHGVIASLCRVRDRRRLARVQRHGEHQRAGDGERTACFEDHVNDCVTSRTLRRTVQVERSRAIAKTLLLVQAEHVHHAEHGVGHRRPVGRVDVQVAFQLARRVTREEQRAALVIVHVRIAHRRAVDHQAVIEKRAVTVRRGLQLVEEVPASG